MYKLVLFMMIGVFIMSMHAVQIDREMAAHTLFRAKYALDRAAKAAVGQLDLYKLGHGVNSIDEAEAYRTALMYLQNNLQLDSSNEPLPDAFLRSRVEVLEFEVVNDDRHFPYHYSNPGYSFDATLRRPGVVIVIRVEYPRTFRLLDPIVWEIKGVAELTNR